LGIVYDDLGERQKAIEYYQSAITLNPNLAGVYHNLALVYENLGELEKANIYFEKAKELLEQDKSLIKSPSENIQEFGKENLPFAVKKIAIRNFQAVKDLEISFPADAQFICFLGQNGDGKTSILQALALGLQGVGKYEELLNENTQIGVEFLENTQNQIHNLYKEKFVWTGFASASKTAGYGTRRLQITGKERKDWEINPFYCLLEQDDEDILNIERWLIDDFLIYETKTELATQVFELLQKILPSDTKVSRKKSEILYQEFGQELPFKKLSAGNKTIVSLVGDILLRLIGEISAHDQEHNRKVKNLRDLEGIVLIDELETHLHPKWQKEFPKLLSEIFPKVQFIVTTHSAICLLGMPKNTAIYKVQRDSEKGTFAWKANIDLENLLPNQIFTSELFDLDIFNVNTESIYDVDTGIMYKNKEEREKEDEALRQILEKYKGGAK